MNQVFSSAALQCNSNDFLQFCMLAKRSESKINVNSRDESLLIVIAYSYGWHSILNFCIK